MDVYFLLVFLLLCSHKPLHTIYILMHIRSKWYSTTILLIMGKSTWSKWVWKLCLNETWPLPPNFLFNFLKIAKRKLVLQISSEIIINIGYIIKSAYSMFSMWINYFLFFFSLRSKRVLYTCFRAKNVNLLMWKIYLDTLFMLWVLGCDPNWHSCRIVTPRKHFFFNAFSNKKWVWSAGKHMEHWKHV